ncbi:MAG: alpha/beta hydrolase [Chloroflexi bacterium]|nr:alpha/beta hydrolase [Chloroflexota bacterium]
MSIPTLPGIRANIVTTPRIRTRVLFAGRDDGVPVVFLHGNTSSATWWEEVMVALPPGFLGIAPDQRGFGEADFEKKIDATRGPGDWADDALALLDELNLSRAHFVGSSMGGSVIWRILMDQPARVLSAIQVDPGSPFGFGGVKDLEGTPCYSDYAGSGGGLANPELIKRLGEGDRSMDSPFSPRVAIRNLVVKPPFIPAREEELLSAMLTMHLGPQDNSGGAEQSPNWPFVAPGVWGAANALSPKYAGDIGKLVAADPKPEILWLRGSHDLLVSDTALADVGYLGMLGRIPGWPGKEIFPPQPMIGQTRAVLDRYAARGGKYREVVIQDAGHAPYVDRLDEFNALLHAHLT